VDSIENGMDAWDTGLEAAVDTGTQKDNAAMRTKNRRMIQPLDEHH